MTLYFDLYGVSFAVMDEKVPGILGSPDRFSIKRVLVRSAAQDIRKALEDPKLIYKLEAAALQGAAHPHPLPAYDVGLGREQVEQRYCTCGRELITPEQLKSGECEFCSTSKGEAALVHRAERSAS